MKRSFAIMLCIVFILVNAISVSAIAAVPVTGISLGSNQFNLMVGDTADLKITFTPANTTQKVLTFATTNKNVASIDATGKITAVGAGTAEITVSSTSNKSISSKCKVTVTAPFSYPVKTNVTLTYWMELHSNATVSATNFADLPIGKELAKQTGIKVKYIHPPTGQAKDAFSILVASGDLPDIIEYKWKDLGSGYPGGSENAFNNGVILKLTDVMNKYCPNLKNYLAENPNIDKQVRSDSGDYFLFPFIRSTKELQTTSGPIIRKDWLKYLNLSVPETIDEWHVMLKAFKDNNLASSPVTAIVSSGSSQLKDLFQSAFVRTDLFHINSKVKYGPYELAYKDFLKTMALWYKEGLIDKNFATADTKARDANMLNSKSGATYGAGGGQMGAWIPVLKTKDARADLTAAKYPVLKKGETPRFGASSFEFAVDGGSAAITTSCKNVELAARYLDFAYGEKGHLVYNFGIAGLSYYIADDNKARYSDLVLKNPDKLSIAQAMSKYSRGNTNGPFVQDVGYIMQFYTLPQQKEALNKYWTAHDFKSYNLPPISYSQDESAEVGKIKTDIDTYVNEYFLKVVMGTEDISTFEAYQAQLKKMGVERYIQLAQSAFDRYNKR